MHIKKFILGVVLIIFVVLLFYLFYQNQQSKFGKIADEKNKQSPTTQEAKKDIEVIAQNLDIPWEVAFLPSEDLVKKNEILVTERSGNLVLIKNKRKIPIAGVEPLGEAGLLGLAIHPQFSSNQFIYLYLTTRSNSNLTNRVERFRFNNNQLSDRKVILEGINGALNHDGGRIAFGPDGFLYITSGDAQNPNSAQDKNSLNGKILRIKDDGGIPSGNPFGNAVYSFGHRNPQGLVWDDQKRLWATEHGRSGLQSGLDELNLIEKGKNYGWPVIQGDEKKEGMVSPIIQSGQDVTWAPSGMAFYGNSLFFGGLRGEALFEYKIVDKSLKEHFKNEFGRIRTVVLGFDNYLYLTTNNTDGRGNPKETDDKLIKINPQIFK